jgi:hypothetical protein
MNRSLLAAGIAVLFGLGSAAIGYGAITSPNPLHSQSYNGISYITGGVGADERAALWSMAKNDNLELSFAAQDKEYLGGAKISVKDSKGKDVLEAASDGPLFYAKLPDGTYVVSATVNGRTITRKVHVSGNNRQTIYFTWNEPGHQVASASSSSKGVAPVAYQK